MVGLGSLSISCKARLWVLVCLTIPLFHLIFWRIQDSLWMCFVLFFSFFPLSTLNILSTVFQSTMFLVRSQMLILSGFLCKWRVVFLLLLSRYSIGLYLSVFLLWHAWSYITLHLSYLELIEFLDVEWQWFNQDSLSLFLSMTTPNYLAPLLAGRCLYLLKKYPVGIYHFTYWANPIWDLLK